MMTRKRPFTAILLTRIRPAGRGIGGYFLWKTKKTEEGESESSPKSSTPMTSSLSNAA